MPVPMYSHRIKTAPCQLNGCYWPGTCQCWREISLNWRVTRPICKSRKTWALIGSLTWWALIGSLTWWALIGSLTVLPDWTFCVLQWKPNKFRSQTFSWNLITSNYLSILSNFFKQIIFNTIYYSNWINCCNRFFSYLLKRLDYFNSLM